MEIGEKVTRLDYTELLFRNQTAGPGKLFIFDQKLPNSNQYTGSLVLKVSGGFQAEVIWPVLLVQTSLLVFDLLQFLQFHLQYETSPIVICQMSFLRYETEKRRSKLFIELQTGFICAENIHVLPISALLRSFWQTKEDLCQRIANCERSIPGCALKFDTTFTHTRVILRPNAHDLKLIPHPHVCQNFCRPIQFWFCSAPNVCQNWLCLFHHSTQAFGNFSKLACPVDFVLLLCPSMPKIRELKNRNTNNQKFFISSCLFRVLCNEQISRIIFLDYTRQEKNKNHI